jgi:four helix bundle protein
MMISYEKNAIVSKTIQFSLQMIQYCDVLYQAKRPVIAKQLLRSSTSIGANVMESQHSESPADFLHKMKIASKEAHETYYWLILCNRSDGYPFEKQYLTDLEEIVRIISRIIITCKTKCS